MDARLWEDQDGIRRFTNEKVQSAIDRVLVGVDGKALVIDVDIDGNGIRSVVAFQWANGWSIGVIGEITSNKEWHAGARVKKVWK